jgi:hypothetical protein
VTYCACGAAARIDGGVPGCNRGAAVPSTICHDGQRIQGDAKKKPPGHLAAYCGTSQESAERTTYVAMPRMKLCGVAELAEQP